MENFSSHFVMDNDCDFKGTMIVSWGTEDGKTLLNFKSRT